MVTAKFRGPSLTYGRRTWDCLIVVMYSGSALTIVV